MAGFDGRDHGRGQRRHRGGQSEREHEHTGKHLGQIVRDGTYPHEQQQADAGHDRPATHEQVRAEAISEHAEAPGQDEDDDRNREQ